MREHHLSVTRTARYYTLGEPSALVRELWIVCHGHGQLAGRFLRQCEGIQEPARLIVAPEALSRYYIDVPGEPHATARVGATWMTREDRLSEIADYVSYLDALAESLLQQLDRESVTVHALGFSQGVATVTRWFAVGRTLIDRLILWGGTVPPDLELRALRARLGAAELVLVSGDSDPVVEPARVAEDEERLRAANVPLRRVQFSGGHRIDAETLATLATESLSRGGARP